MATGKRNKEGRKRRKEQERVEYLDHQKRRLENYIKAEVSFLPPVKWRRSKTKQNIRAPFLIH